MAERFNRWILVVEQASRIGEMKTEDELQKAQKRALYLLFRCVVLRSDSPESAIVGIDADAIFVKTLDDDESSTRGPLVEDPLGDQAAGFSDPALGNPVHDVQDPIEWEEVDEEWKDWFYSDDMIWSWIATCFYTGPEFVARTVNAT